MLMVSLSFFSPQFSLKSFTLEFEVFLDLFPLIFLIFCVGEKKISNLI